MTRGVRKKCL